MVQVRIREVKTATLRLAYETTDGAGRAFTGSYRRVLIDHVGHFPQRENAAETVREIVRHLRENG